MPVKTSLVRLTRHPIVRQVVHFNKNTLFSLFITSKYLDPIIFPVNMFIQKHNRFDEVVVYSFFESNHLL